MAQLHLNIEQARAAQAQAPSAWTIEEVEGGYRVGRENVVLVTSNRPRPRVFKSIDGAIRRLRQEAGVNEFKVKVS